MRKIYLFGIIGGLISVGALFVYSIPLSGERNEPLRFTDFEAGFNGETEGKETPITPPGILVLPERDGRPYVGWGQYWQDLTLEEERYYQSTAQKNWDGFRVGIQSGHWRVAEVPDELAGLKRNGSGAVGGGTTEAVVVLEISRRVQELLEAEGVLVDLLPSTIPPGYFADAFVSIHADGSTSERVSGFKIAAPRRDFSGRAHMLVAALYDSYEEETAMRRDTSITRRMSSYYAFNFRRYEHALHPFVPAVIFEVGFLTSPTDRLMIVDNPGMVARGIASGIIDFLMQSRYE